MSGRSRLSESSPGQAGAGLRLGTGARPRLGFRWGSAGAGAEVRGYGGWVGAGGRAEPCQAGSAAVSPLPRPARAAGGLLWPPAGAVGTGSAPARAAPPLPCPPRPSPALPLVGAKRARLRETSGGTGRCEGRFLPRAELSLGRGCGALRWQRTEAAAAAVSWRTAG